MNISKFKCVLKLATGGVAGLVEYLLELFNEQVLSKITSKEDAAAYCKDVKAIGECLKIIAENHKGSMSEEKRVAFDKTVDAVNALAGALEDCEIKPEELDAIIDDIEAAIEAWKDAK